MKAKDFKLFIISGHGETDPGACANGYEEKNCTRALAKLVYEDALARGISATLYDQSKNANIRIKAGQMPEFAGKNLCLEIHLNASATQDTVGNGAMVGSMCYQKVGSRANPCAQRMLDNLYAIGSKKAWDGIVDTNRGYPVGLLVQNRCEEAGTPHVLLETCFITDIDDMGWFWSSQGKIASALVQAVMDTYDLQGGDPKPSDEILNGTIDVVYAGPDGISLHSSADLSANSVIGKLKHGDLRRAVKRVTAPTGDPMYQLEDGQYVTGVSKYTMFFLNDYAAWVGTTNSPDGTLIVRDFPSTKSGICGQQLFELYNGNLFDVIGEAYNFGDHWYQIHIKNATADIVGWVAARFVE